MSDFKALFLDCRSLDLVLGSQLVSIGAVRSQKSRTILYRFISQLNLCFKRWIVDVDPVLFDFRRVVLCNNCMFRNLKGIGIRALAEQFGGILKA
ncbi:MAG: hypothetical protein RL012_433 [Bacteroidota bacterium]|jgi:hypothetical protein